MPYSSGTATDIVDLESKLETWLTGLSSPWTVDRSDAQGTGRRLQVHKGTTYASMRFVNNENPTSFASAVFTGIYLMGGTGYSAGSDWYNNTGAVLAADGSSPLPVGCECLTASIPYHFFADVACDNIWIVVQKTTGVWGFIGWGASIDKVGSWTGGRWFAGALARRALGNASDNAGRVVPPFPTDAVDSAVGNGPRLLVRLDADGFGEEWRGLTSSGEGTSAKTTRQLGGNSAGRNNNLNSAQFSYLWGRSRSQLAQAPIVLPQMPLTSRSSGLFSWIGAMPLIRSCFTRNVVVDSGTFTVGSDTYRAFGSFAVKVV